MVSFWVRFKTNQKRVLLSHGFFCFETGQASDLPRSLGLAELRVSFGELMRRLQGSICPASGGFVIGSAPAVLPNIYIYIYIMLYLCMCTEYISILNGNSFQPPLKNIFDHYVKGL